MRDFIISVILSFFINISFVASYLDPYRDLVVEKGLMNNIEAGKLYYAIIFALLLMGGIIVYTILEIIKYFLNKVEI